MKIFLRENFTHERSAWKLKSDWKEKTKMKKMQKKIKRRRDFRARENIDEFCEIRLKLVRIFCANKFWCRPWWALVDSQHFKPFLYPGAIHKPFKPHLHINYNLLRWKTMKYDEINCKRCDQILFMRRCSSLFFFSSMQFLASTSPAEKEKSSSTVFPIDFDDFSAEFGFLKTQWNFEAFK